MAGESSDQVPSAEALDALMARAGSEPFDRLIYLFGNARGGTSFLKDIVALHPAVISFAGPTHFLNHVWRHRKKVTDRLWRLIFWMPFFDARHRLRDQAPPEARARFETLVGKALSSRDLNRIYRCYPLIQAADPASDVDVEAMRAWVDKGNDCWGVDALAAAFPQARFVAILRDPRAAIASISGRLAGKRTGSPSSRELMDVTAAAIYWCNVTQTSLRLVRRHRGRSTLVRYEDLVLAPQPTVRALYDFADLPPLAEADLAERLAGIAYGSSMDAKDLGTGISTRPLTRWREVLDPESLDLIAEICGPTARVCGYPLPRPATRRGPWRIAGRMASPRARALALAKLVYLRLRTPGSADGVARIGTLAPIEV